ncbi:hypothetical protein GCY85_22370 [Escherichia coli]|nr:hypothetical protein [Escherichia coli]
MTVINLQTRKAIRIYETRHTDQNYGTYLCYWVHFSPKDTDGLSFSVRRAVRAIASVAAEHP